MEKSQCNNKSSSSASKRKFELDPAKKAFLYERVPEEEIPKKARQTAIAPNFNLKIVDHQIQRDDSTTNTDKKKKHPHEEYPQVFSNFHLPEKYQAYFTYIQHDGLDRIVVKCKVIRPDAKLPNCEKRFAVTVGNYSNLNRHLRSKVHQIQNVHGRCFAVESAPVETVPQEITPHCRQSARQKKFDKNVLNMMAEGLPFNFVEKASFKNLVKYLDPRMQVKSRQTYGKQLALSSSNDVEPKLKKLFSLAPSEGSHFSLDIWSTRNRISALGIKIHLIDDSWNHCVRTVELSEFSVTHSGENIKSKFEEFLDKYEISKSKVGLIISDNASNFKKAFNMEPILGRTRSTDHDLEFDNLEDSDVEENCADNTYSSGNFVDALSSDEENDEEGLDSEDLLLLREPGWSPCLAHTVQLAVNGAIKSHPSVTLLVKKVNELVVFFRRSPKKLAIYRKEVFEICNCPNKSGHELILPNTTRWNSTLFALQRMSKDDVFKAVQNIVRDHEPGLQLTSRKKSELIELVSLLKPVQILTDHLQSDGLTSNIVTIATTTAFLDISNIITTHFGGFQKCLLENLKSRLSNAISNKWFTIAAVLDPRQKLTLYQPGNVQWKDEQRTLSLPAVYEIEEFFRTKMAKEGLETELDSTVIHELIQPVVESSEKNKTIFSIIKRIPLTAPRESPLLHEYKLYIQQPLEEDENLNPLDYWRKYCFQFPILAKIAKRVFSIPASSGSVERLFSYAGALGRARRAKLKLDKVSQLIKLKESLL